MVHWVYILRCEDDVIYVGETKNLFTRFSRHRSGCGSRSTSQYEMTDIECIYRLEDLMNFFEYDKRLDYYLKEDKYKRQYTFKDNALEWYSFDNKYNFSQSHNLQSENFIVERLMLDTNEIDFTSKFTISGEIRGGKYTRDDCQYTHVNPKELLEKYPLCHCGFPCDVRLNSDKDEVYFRCAKKNFWEDMIESLDIDNSEPCNFYKKYEKGEEVKAIMKSHGVKVIEDEKVYLKVPFHEKDDAKDLGCRWDSSVKLWYCKRSNLDVVKRWLPPGG